MFSAYSYFASQTFRTGLRGTFLGVEGWSERESLYQTEETGNIYVLIALVHRFGSPLEVGLQIISFMRTGTVAVVFAPNTKSYKYIVN